MPSTAHGSGGVTGVIVGSEVGSMTSIVGVAVMASAHGGELSVWLPSSQYGIGVTVTHSGERGWPVGMQSGSNGVVVGGAQGGEAGPLAPHGVAAGSSVIL